LPPYSPNDFPGNVQAKGSKGLQDAKWNGQVSSSLYSTWYQFSLIWPPN
jgi:hypothetical protein